MEMDLAATVVDHGLRASAREEVALVHQAATRLGIRVHTARVDKLEAEAALVRGSVQSWARDKRYHLLCHMADISGMTHLATGHTMDDQAETLLIRLLRGTGVDGLVGIHRARAEGGIRLIRPLLDFRRNSLRDYLRYRGVSWADDPSNTSMRFTRTRVRTEVLPLLNDIHPETTRRLAALASEANAMVQYVDDVSIGSASITKLRLSDGVKVKKTVFERAPRGMWGRIVRTGIRAVSGHLRGVERCHIAALERLLAAGAVSGEIPLPQGRVAYAHRGDLYVFPRALQPPPSDGARPVSAGDGRWRIRCEPLGASADVTSYDPDLADSLTIRSRKKGDKLLNSKRKLKTVLSKAGIPRPFREVVPLLARKNEVLAIPGLVQCREPSITVKWTIDEEAPYRDLPFSV